MCGCAGDIPQGSSVKGEPCEQVTVEILNLYQSLVECVITKGEYAATKTNNTECAKAVAILQEWKEAISNNQGCSYYHYFPVMQDLIKRIILSSICR